MNDTDTLIDQLAARAAPVKRLGSPGRRTLLWTVLAATIVAIIVSALGARPGWLQDLAVPSAAIEWIASVVTSVLAAYAVFQISVPGRSPSWAWLPLPSALLWLGGIGLGCLRDFGQFGTGAFAFQLGGAECAWAVALISLPLGLLMLLMVRHAGVVRPGATAMLIALSSAALSSAAVSVAHGYESALMVLLWHVGVVVVLSSLSWLFGRQLFSWIGYARS